jgi:cytochrome c-type biogenesis protein CcmE
MTQDLDVLADAPNPPPPARTPRPAAARVRVLVCLAVVVAALGWITVRGLSGALVFYLTPSDVLIRHQASVGQVIRLGGYVVPGSVGHAGPALTFTVTDGTRSMPVLSTGAVPELFKAGQGVVLEGAMAANGSFHSDTLLIQHNGDYRPPNPGETPPNSADLVSGS